MKMVTKLQKLLKNVEVTEPVVANRLQVFGLRWTNVPPLDYVTLDEALERDLFEVTEVDEGGSVPTLLVTNKTDSLVFLMAGEQLVGAKQNRALNASIMVGAKSKTPVPVSCVEQGRWGYQSRKFHGSGSSSHGYLRKQMSRYAYEGYRETGRPTSKQGEVWAEVDRKLDKMGSSSPSDALYATYEDHREKLAETVAKARVPEGCSGVVFAFGGRVAGMDLFDKPATLNRLLPKLVQSYALDALEESNEATVDRAAVTTWLQSSADAVFERYESPGLGDDVRVEGKALVGAGLVVEACPVHVELFPEYDDDPGRPVRPRPSDPPSPAMAAPVTPSQSASSDELVVLPTSREMLRLTTEAVPQMRSVLGVGLRVSLQLVDEEERGENARGVLVLSHEDESRLVSLARERMPGTGLRLVLTSNGLADNWFSHYHEDARTSVVSVCDWEQLSPLPVAAFLAQSLVMHSLRLRDSCDPRQLLHEQTRGCLFDFCKEKADVNHKLRSGDVCPECRAKLTEMGVSVPAVLHMLETVRRLAIEAG